MFHVNMVHMIEIRIHETDRENTLTKGLFSMLFPIILIMLTTYVYDIKLKKQKKLLASIVGLSAFWMLCNWSL